MAIDDRTPALNFPKPNQDNTLFEDVARLRSALDAIDAAILERQAALGFTPENVANKGTVNGYAGLDATGKVPASQLPSYVDDVLEYPTQGEFPTTGEAGKLYVALDSSRLYRWAGSNYVWISPSPGSTDAVPEGATNKYFTDTRARDAQLPATASALGVVKIGSGLSVGLDGTLSAVGGGEGTGVPAFNELTIIPSSNGQTVFAPVGGYSVGQIELYLNGVLLYGNGDDYTASNGTTFTLVAGINTTDTLLLRRWTTTVNLPFFSLLDKPTTLAGYGITDAYSAVNGQLAGMRNKIINGKMEIAQRGTNFTTPVAGLYVLDRWRVDVSTTAVATVSQQSDVPSDNEFQNSLRFLVTTADASIAAGEFALISQYIEGYNVRDLIGRTFTLRFRAWSSKTGVHCIAFGNGVTADRTYVAEYTVNAANTWEDKTVTVNGGLITAGTWNWTNGVGLRVSWALAAGTTFHTAPGAWNTGNFFATSSQVNCLDTVGNIFAITGVQLEAGPVATPFEHRPYGSEAALCYRYCWVPETNPSFSMAWTAGAVSFLGGNQQFPVSMRAAPTILGVSTYTIQGVTTNATGFALGATRTTFYLTGSASNSQAEGFMRLVNPNETPIFSAEL